jgi:regulator of sirC expression with transglutaminase-like and TPR domain
MFRLLVSTAGLALAVAVHAAESPPADKDAPKAPTVAEIAAKLRPSVVVITVEGRDGRRESLGTGFVVAADGLIATNRHVIGEGRKVTVETADGKKHEVVAVHASDRPLDLAVLRIAARGLRPLELGDSATLKDGQAVVAVGNPQGLKHSVVAGVVSGVREIDGRSMIQVAIPIEPGNSGGPLVDMQGRVHGILTIKSLVTANLGFAVPINSLKPLLARPNPVPMAAWLTIGQLDPDEWQPRMGSRWWQRAGHIHVAGPGSGFGGRSLCLSKRPTPPVPFEVAVTVRLDDESGAAGLVFHSDGDDRHYGFYPSGGQLRLTRFDGPDVFTWKVLAQRSSPHYHPGEWNVVKVRVEKDRFSCFVNDQLVVTSTDADLTEGQVGLAKFRNTVAEFKYFHLGKTVTASAAPTEMAARIGKAIDSLPSDRPAADTIDKLAGDGPLGPRLLRERARQLEKQAARLREIAAAVHQKTVLDELVRATAGKEENIDLVYAALLLARLDNEDVEVEVYRSEVERMARKVRERLKKDGTENVRIETLNRYLFEERGFHGSRGDYYNRSNSYISEVIDDREGLPITLSVLYIELARRLGLKVEGVGLPAHFVVRHVPAKGEPRLIDVYEGGKVLSREEAAKKVEALTGKPLRDEHLAATTKKAILVRMLHNLLNVANQERDTAGMLRYLDGILALNTDAGPERAVRAALLYQQGDRTRALQDVDWLLDHGPEDVDLDRVRQLRKAITESEK